MGGTLQRHSLRRSLIGAGLLVVVMLLTFAGVVPAVHHLWHAGHGCDQPDCVVVAFAQGKVDPTAAPMPEFIRVAGVRDLPEQGVTAVLIATDCPPLPGRAPPV
ncbi:MAG: hypothetical protein KF833_17830 [Verrucomicrobiae bacterium]|nr:hypothetical protein [Verrucomicrobiae bacterium]